MKHLLNRLITYLGLKKPIERDLKQELIDKRDNAICEVQRIYHSPYGPDFHCDKSRERDLALINEEFSKLEQTDEG